MVATANGVFAMVNDNIIAVRPNGRVCIHDSGKSSYTSAQFKTAMDGVYLAYELATPVEIDLTPVQIRAIVGENNVWADCGQSTVKYLAEG